ncbi:MAG TPA: hypothetical protein VK358_02585, partial [Longimicrobium sp.]|nr:hypothetical protein [Longimicrobium sp.]
MRTLRRFSALALLLLASACDDGPTLPGDQQMTARLDGREWKGDAAVYFTADTVTLITREPIENRGTARFSTTGGNWRELMLMVVASGPGEYQVVPERSRYEEIIGGDQIAYSAPVTAGRVRFTALKRGEARATG